MTIHERFPFTWKESRKPKVDIRKEKAKDALKEDVGALNLSTRAYNALKRASINTIDDLISAKDRLYNVKNIGGNSVIEIHTKLLAYLKQYARKE